jgi:hypothetical protein
VTNKPVKAEKKESHGQGQSITFRLAPLAVQVFEGVDLPKGKASAPEKLAKGKAAKKAGSKVSKGKKGKA